nr:MAG TPA: hypothetical protein [Bacteriophage sp.]
MDKKTCLEKLKGCVLNNVNGNKRQLLNTVESINNYLDEIDNLLIKIREGETNNIENLKRITELSVRLRVLFELKILYNSNVSVTSYIRKELEALKK